MDRTVAKVLRKMDWMRQQHIWPNGLRYLWTDAFGVVLLVSLYHELNRDELLAEAQHVVADVERVLGPAWTANRRGNRPRRAILSLSGDVDLRADAPRQGYSAIS